MTPVYRNNKVEKLANLASSFKLQTYLANIISVLKFSKANIFLTKYYNTEY